MLNSYWKVVDVCSLPVFSPLRLCVCHTSGWSPSRAPSLCLPGGRTRPWSCSSTAGTDPEVWSGCSGPHSEPCSAEPTAKKKNPFNRLVFLWDVWECCVCVHEWLLPASCLCSCPSSRTPELVTFLVSTIVFRSARQAHVFRHVRRQYLEDRKTRRKDSGKEQHKEPRRHLGAQTFPHHVYDHSPQRLPLLLGEVLEDVTVVFLQQLEAHGQVVVLQHWLIVVHESQLRVWGEAREGEREKRGGNVRKEEIKLSTTFLNLGQVAMVTNSTPLKTHTDTRETHPIKSCKYLLCLFSPCRLNTQCSWRLAVKRTYWCWWGTGWTHQGGPRREWLRQKWLPGSPDPWRRPALQEKEEE